MGTKGFKIGGFICLIAVIFIAYCSLPIAPHFELSTSSSIEAYAWPRLVRIPFIKWPPYPDEAVMDFSVYAEPIVQCGEIAYECTKAGRENRKYQSYGERVVAIDLKSTTKYCRLEEMISIAESNSCTALILLTPEDPSNVFEKLMALFEHVETSIDIFIIDESDGFTMKNEGNNKNPKRIHVTAIPETTMLKFWNDIFEFLKGLLEGIFVGIPTAVVYGKLEIQLLFDASVVYAWYKCMMALKKPDSESNCSSILHIQIPNNLNCRLSVTRPSSRENEAVITRIQNNFEPDSSATSNQNLRVVRRISVFPEIRDIGGLPDEILTFDSLRQYLYQFVPGVETFAPNRQNFLQWLITNFKNPGPRAMNPFKKPYVIFPGEEGIDEGALRREMYRLGFESLVHDRVSIIGQSSKVEKVPIFEGEDNRRIPTANPILVKNGIFESVGLFLAHAIIHVGMALPGVSPAVVHYLCCAEDQVPVSILDIQDIPDYELRVALDGLKDSIETMDTENRRTLQNAAKEAGHPFIHSQNNLGWSERQNLKNKLIYYNVITKRKAELNAMKAPFKKLGLIPFLELRPFLIPAIFPTLKSLRIPKDILFKNISGSGDYHRVLKILVNFVESSEDEHVVEKVLNFWTGWSYLPDEPLQLHVVTNNETKFAVHACSMQMVVPANISKKLFRRYLEELCGSGSGSMEFTIQ